MTTLTPPSDVAIYTAVTRARELIRRRQDARRAAVTACEQTGLPLHYIDHIARLAARAETACAEARRAMSTAGAARVGR